jgi:heme oxygenase
MSLKEITADLHDLAESTPFMKAVFAGTLPLKTWEEWTYWRTIFYSSIEEQCENGNLLEDLQDIKRGLLLMQDYREMRNGNCLPSDDCNNPALDEYLNYIKTLYPKQALAHLYVWHMGDLYGGQMIKKVVPAPTHYALEFTDATTLKNNLRAKLTDDLGPEARIAFEYAIKMLNAIYHGQSLE